MMIIGINTIKEINNETKIKKEEKIFENTKDNSEIKNSESKSFSMDISTLLIARKK